MPTGRYCSDTCAQEMEEFMKKAADLPVAVTGSRGARLVRKIIKYTVVLAIIVISVLPMIYELIKGRVRKASEAEAVDY